MQDYAGLCRIMQVVFILYVVQLGVADFVSQKNNASLLVAICHDVAFRP